MGERYVPQLSWQALEQVDIGRKTHVGPICANIVGNKGHVRVKEKVPHHFDSEAQGLSEDVLCEGQRTGFSDNVFIDEEPPKRA